MGLVDYSDSDSDNEASKARPQSSRPIPPAESAAGVKRKREQDSSDLHAAKAEGSAVLPPLPSRFHDLYTSASRISTRDDPRLHGGRTRLIPHVEGNWATHIYLEWHPTQTEFECLSALLSASQDAQVPDDNKIHSHLASDLGTQLPLHISLSRPVVLNTEQREQFTEFLEESVAKSGVRPFQINFTTLDWVSNYEKTRWFLVLRIDQPAQNELNRLLWLSNRVVRAFHQPPLYVPDSPPSDVAPQALGTGRSRAQGFGRQRDSRGAGTYRKFGRDRAEQELLVDCSSHFHVSLGWSLAEPSPESVNRTSSTDILTLLKRSVLQLTVGFEAVKLKIGNAITVLPLQTKVKEGTGLIGL